MIEQAEPLPPHTRPARLGGKTGRLARATSRNYADESYFANHVRFFWTERGTKYAATLHYFGPRTRRLLGWLIAHLRPAAALPRRSAGDGERVRTFATPVPGPVSVAFGRGRVWVAGQGDRTISASWLAPLDPGSGRVLGRRIPIAHSGGAVALAADDRPDAAVWVARRGAPGLPGLQRLAPGAERLNEPIDLRPELLAVERSRTALWLADYGGWPGARRYRSGSILRTDAAGRRVVARIPVGRAPADLALGGGGLWVTNNLDGTVSRIDVASNRVVAVVRAGMRPTGVAAGAGAVWVADYAGGRISRIDPATNAVVARIRVGPGPRGVAVGEGGVWVTSELADTVARIDADTNRVIETLRVGGAPVDVAVGGGYVLTADGDDQAVTRIAP